MGAALSIYGHKGGDDKPYVPKEATDSLISVAKAKILLALGEGEFEGRLTGRDIYLDGTPLLDSTGAENFPGVTWEFRPGSQHQAYIQGMPSVENEVSQSVELRADSPYIRAVTNTQLSAVRLRFKWPFLQRQKDNGDVVGWRIEYAIDVQTDGGAYQNALTTAVDGKTTTGYERSHRIDLPAANNGWQIRVRRLTPNQDSGRYADTMQVVAFTEVIDEKFRYPNTALLFVEFDASQFQNIPQIACEPYGRIWQVPSNYDPETRIYTGAWDGTFKSAWTDNPAWVTYGIILSDRFGLGRRVDASMVDKWELYRIAQYCDQLVPDGKGGSEPRYKCDLYIQSKADAWVVLRDLAAIYRGMTYWAGGQMISHADMPRDVDFIYTRANVIDGKFNYSSSSERVRYTRALVSWDNPANGYESDVTPFSDLKLQRRYGDNVIELAAIGCTRESEAQRRGKWAVLTNSKDRTVTFQVGLDGNIPLPGHIIGVADPLLAGRAIGGRISEVAGRWVTLDRVSAAKVGDRLIVNLPSGQAEGRTVSAVDGLRVQVSTEYSELPEAQLQWSIDADDLAIQLYRVTSRTRDEAHLFTISATFHDASKFEHIDTGARIEERPITVTPPGVQAPPTDVTISSNTATSQGLAVTTMTIAWTPPENAVGFDVEWRRDSGDWIRLPRTGNSNIDVEGIYAGNYLARVRAVNAMGVSSVPATSALTTLAGKVGAPPALASLVASSILFGVSLRWTFPEGTDDTQRTELQYNTTPSEQGVLQLGDFAYPQNTHVLTGLAAGTSLWFRARLVDRTGNVGPWSPFVNGQASSDAGPILDYLSGQITDTQLSQALLEQIEGGGDAMVVVQELVNELAAMYTIKTQLTVDGKPYLAGIGVGVENEEGIVTSQVLIAASRFAVIDPNTGETVYPFVIQNGQVFINEAFIGSATITNALLGATLESVAQTPEGEPVLSLNFQTGELKSNAVVPGGGRLSITNRAVKVFDAAGALRVQLGDLSA